MSVRQKESNENFEQLKWFFDQIMELSSDGIVIVDKNAYIIAMNDAYCHYFGREKAEVVGKHITEIIKNTKMPELLKTGKTEVDATHTWVSGQTPSKEKSIIVTRSVIKDNQGNIIGAIGRVKFFHETKRLAEKLQELNDTLQYYKKELNRLSEHKYSFNNIIGKSSEMLDIIKMSEKAAQNDFTVLILGATGTGKEVFANAIHYASKRKYKPFIRVNCAAIPSELLESELFGYEEGSFTGAKKGGKKGKFELANGGTIFLDEIGDMPLNMQAKLLRVLQEKEVEKVGASKTIPIDVRVIAATNQKIEENIRNNKFRADLYYRLNVIQIKLPLLSERKVDIPLFIQHFLDGLNEKYGTYVTMSEKAKEALMNYSWPGNVRELQNIIERAYTLVDDNIILLSNLPASIKYKKKVNNFVGSSRSMDSIINEFEKELILTALKENNYNYKLTAEKFKIHRSTLYKKLDKLNINRKNIVE